jgi:hypothetical protein
MLRFDCALIYNFRGVTLMTKLLKGGCGLLVVIGIVIALALLISSDLRELFMVIGMMMFVMVVGGMAENSIPSNFHETQADIVSVKLADETKAFNIGTITLKYEDENGTTHTKVARPFSNRAKVAGLEAGDTLRIGVCRKDPTAIKIPFIRVNDDSKCDLLSKGEASPKETTP